MNPTSPSSFTDTLARFLRDLLKMGDLQLQLLSLDIKAVGNSARFGIILAVIAAAMLLGSIPVVMFGVAGVVHLAMHLPLEYAWLVVGGMAMLVGVILLIISVACLARATHSMRRSHEEFRRNLEWMRSVLNQQ
jgi:hypothetical protein